MPLLITEIEQLTSNALNMTNASKACRDILYFTYFPYELDLPTGALEAFGSIPENRNPPMDILRQESSNLLRLFVKQFDPNLTRQRRVQILRDILKYCTNRERQLLLSIVRDRKIPGIKVEYIVRILGTDFLDSIDANKAPSSSEPDKPKKVFEAFRDLKTLGIPQP